MGTNLKQVYWIDDEVLSPLGNSTQANMESLLAGKTGFENTFIPDWLKSNTPVSIINPDEVPFEKLDKYTRLEKLMIKNIQSLLEKSNLPRDKKTQLFISSTKGNIDLLYNTKLSSRFVFNRFKLSSLGKVIQTHFGFENTPIIISNACVSGTLAISIAAEYLQHTDIEHAIVCSGDEISEFIHSGFESFQALSDAPCKPFDKDRKGLNLGEAFVCVHLTNKENYSKPLGRILAFGNINDANHISGPSRTGEGLYRSIMQALESSSIPKDKIGCISSHGTSTLYNDEMESIALHRAGLSEVPLHSLKGYYGHTLGSSALLESALTLHSMKNNLIYGTKGFENLGTSHEVNIDAKTRNTDKSMFLKLASGFGGCNVAQIIEVF